MFYIGPFGSGQGVFCPLCASSAVILGPGKPRTSQSDSLGTTDSSVASILDTRTFVDIAGGPC